MYARDAFHIILEELRYRALNHRQGTILVLIESH